MHDQDRSGSRMAVATPVTEHSSWTWRQTSKSRGDLTSRRPGTNNRVSRSDLLIAGEWVDTRRVGRYI